MSLNQNNIDIELAQAHTQVQLEGYPSFAEFIAQDSDAAIYRKFERLSARNLLYLQSELQDLEGQLQAFDQEDAKDINDEEAQKTARSWRHYSDEGNGRSRKHREIQAKIIMKIKEYRMWFWKSCKCGLLTSL
jgi:hypothetical protein